MKLGSWELTLTSFMRPYSRTVKSIRLSGTPLGAKSMSTSNMVMFHLQFWIPAAQADKLERVVGLLRFDTGWF